MTINHLEFGLYETKNKKIIEHQTLLYMIWKSFNKITTFFNYSSPLLESSDSLDTLDLLDAPGFTWRWSWRRWQQLNLINWWISCIWRCILFQVFLFPRSFVLVFVLRYFLVGLIRISSFSCLFQAFLFSEIKIQSSIVL